MFVKLIYRHFVFNQKKYQVCKFRIYRHFVKSVNGSNFPVGVLHLFCLCQTDVMFWLCLLNEPPKPFVLSHICCV